MPIFKIREFLELESSGGILLLIMAVLSIIWVNSPLASAHKFFLDNFLFLINDGLMSAFFLLVGLELKREFLSGQLSSKSQITLPAIAAIGGMIVPAVIYTVINFHDPMTIKGWAIPVATDIAFALGVLSLFGSRIPVGLKMFLLALSIFDDIGAIFIIALFYTQHLSFLWLFLSIIVVFILILFNRLTVRFIPIYLVGGLLLWFCIWSSGVHPTISGVLLAMTIPTHNGHSPLMNLENFLHPWVAYLIIPLFALANAGFSFTGLSPEIMHSSVALGICLGLFVGKQIGVFGFSWLMIKSSLAKLPQHSSWLTLYGVSLLCGIGFTMSLFLGTLSFQNADIYLTEVRLGVLAGSVLSGLVGGLILLLGLTIRGKE